MVARATLLVAFCALTASAHAESYLYTVAGTGARPATGGGLATEARLHAGCVAGLRDGSFLVATQMPDDLSARGSRIWQVRPDGLLRPFAGTGRSGFTGDGGQATAAAISGCAMGPEGNGGVLLADRGNRRVRRISSDGRIATVADPGAATVFDGPASVAALDRGAFLFATGRALEVVGQDGSITVVGGSRALSCTQPTPAHATVEIGAINAIAAAPDGGVYVAAGAPMSRTCVVHVNMDGAITPVAGIGASGHGGDGGPAGLAELTPTALVPLAAGGLLIGDDTVVRKVDPSGIISTVANLGSTVSGLAPAADGGFYGVTSGQVFAVDATGVLRTLMKPGGQSIASMPDGSLLIGRRACCGAVGEVVRLLQDGTSARVAGGGSTSVAVGAAATDLRMDPYQIAPGRDGSFYVDDLCNYCGGLYRIGADGHVAEIVTAADTPSGFAPISEGRFAVAYVLTGERNFVGLVENGRRSEIAGRFRQPAVGVRATEVDVAPAAPAAVQFAPTTGGDFIYVSNPAQTQYALVDGATGEIKSLVDLKAEGVVRLLAHAWGRTLLVTTPARGREVVRELLPNGRFVRLAGGGVNGFFGTTAGEPASKADVADATNVAPTPDGGVLLASGDHVDWLAPARTTTLEVAISPETLRRVAHNSIAVRATVGASFVETVERAGSSTRRSAGTLHAGLNTVALPKGLKPGVYDVTIDARDKHGARAASTHRLLLGGRLPRGVAQTLARRGSGGVVSACKMWSSTRTDCAVANENCGSNECETECHVAAILLKRDGVVYERDYARRSFASDTAASRGGACGPGGGFKRRPRWGSSKLEQASPL